MKLPQLMHRGALHAVAAALLTTFAMVACTMDEYETGDGKYSYLRADFATVRTAESKTIVTATTDEGEALVITPSLTCEWATTPDSTYRALLYYSRVPDALPQVEAFSAMRVLVLQPISKASVKQPGKLPADPLVMESAWIGNDGRYLNLGLYVKTGKEGEGDKQQSIGVVCDTIVALDNGTREHRLHLIHHQNGVPEYYSSRVYASIPLDSISRGDAVTLEVNTYEGVRRSSFVTF